MMTTITVIPSVTVTFKDIQDVFGGVNPISLSEYYTDSTSGLTTGVTGIPALNNPISLSMFRDKSKPTPVVLGPTPVATSFTGNYIVSSTYHTGDRSLYTLTGCSGENLSRTGVSTFNNIGISDYGREMIIYYPNLILQAKAGDQIGFIINTKHKDNKVRRIRIYTNTGTGWILKSGTTADVTIGTDPADTTINTIFKFYISASASPGNYGIMFVTSDTTDIFSNTARNVYSLHVYE